MLVAGLALLAACPGALSWDEFLDRVGVRIRTIGIAMRSAHAAPPIPPDRGVAWDYANLELPILHERYLTDFFTADRVQPLTDRDVPPALGSTGYGP